jgi:gluconate 2-dehydrogenase gamma chain
MQRRNVLITMAAAATGASVPLLRAANANAEAAAGATPDPATHWEAGAANPAMPPRAAGLLFLTAAEAEALGAMADCLIPADELSIGGKEAGCVTFIDRQLDGTFGHGVSDYRLGPYHRGTPEQGPQNQLTPAQRYRAGLKALHAYCQQQYGKTYAQLDAATQDAVLTSMEQNKLALGDVESKPLFELILQNVREGFLADPVYGGNKDMASWKMLGFPGARYDFRDYMDQKGKKQHFIPVSLVSNSR